VRVDGTEPPTGFRCGWLGGFGGQRLGLEFGQGGGTAVDRGLGFLGLQRAEVGAGQRLLPIGQARQPARGMINLG
jgi:hypothetical protein